MKICYQPSNSAVELDIQRQMVDEKNSLGETTVGKYLQKGLLHAFQRREINIAQNQEDPDDSRINIKEYAEAALPRIVEKKGRQYGRKTTQINNTRAGVIAATGGCRSSD